MGMTAAQREALAAETCAMVAARLNASAEAADGGAPKFWVPAGSPEDLWRLVSVSRLEGGVATVQEAGGEEESLPLSVAHPHDASHDADLTDVCEMADLHQAPLLAMLRRRWRASKIYTAAGNVLTSINPYRPLPGSVYEVPATVAEMTAKYGAGAEPHLFRWAHRAYDALVVGDAVTNQAIVVNGESGAGKTMASTLIVESLGRSFLSLTPPSLARLAVVRARFL